MDAFTKAAANADITIAGSIAN